MRNFLDFIAEAIRVKPKVKPKSKPKPKPKKKRKCPKCEGTGYLPQYAYIRDGICWKCGGTGYMRDYDTETDVWLDEDED